MKQVHDLALENISLGHGMNFDRWLGGALIPYRRDCALGNMLRYEMFLWAYPED